MKVQIEFCAFRLEGFRYLTKLLKLYHNYNVCSLLPAEKWGSVSEWLRSEIANLMLSECVSSNLTAVDKSLSFDSFYDTAPKTNCFGPTLTMNIAATRMSQVWVEMP